MDPLAQLQDIQLPAQISNYPIAPGWIALYIVILSLFVFTAIKLKQRVRLKRPQKHALKQLAQAGTASDYITILKWAMMAYFPRHLVANLSGTELQAFLSEQLTEKHKTPFKEQGTDLLITYYQKHFDEQQTQQLKAMVEFWISNALPPKAIKVKEAS